MAGKFLSSEQNLEDSEADKRFPWGKLFHPQVLRKLEIHWFFLRWNLLFHSVQFVQVPCYRVYISIFEFSPYEPWCLVRSGVWIKIDPGLYGTPTIKSSRLQQVNTSIWHQQVPEGQFVSGHSQTNGDWAQEEWFNGLNVMYTAELVKNSRFTAQPSTEKSLPQVTKSHFSWRDWWKVLQKKSTSHQLRSRWHNSYIVNSYETTKLERWQALSADSSLEDHTADAGQITISLTSCTSSLKFPDGTSTSPRYVRLGK